MSKDKLKSEANPSLVVLRDNKPKWYLPETRREGYRNLHKINRYGLLYRSDLVLKLNTKQNKNIENIPSVKKSEIKGIKVCRQAKASWVEEFDKRKNPFGQEYYWLTGKFVNKDKGEDTDEWALNQNYISIVPVEFDLTAHHAIQELNEWNFK